MNSNQLMAIYLAHWLQHGQMGAVEKEDIAASNELKRLYFKNQALETENATLQSGYNAARLEIARLQAKLAASAVATAAAPVVLPGPDRDDTYTRRVIEALHENGDPVSVDAAEEMERLHTLLSTCGQAKAVPVAVTTDEELAKLSGENAGSKMATVFHPSASGFQVKLYTAPQAHA